MEIVQKVTFFWFWIDRSFDTINLQVNCALWFFFFFFKRGVHRSIHSIFFSLTAWGNLGNVLKNQGEISEAEKAYRNALYYRSNMADMLYNL